MFLHIIPSREEKRKMLDEETNAKYRDLKAQGPSFAVILSLESSGKMQTNFCRRFFHSNSNDLCIPAL